MVLSPRTTIRGPEPRWNVHALSGLPTQSGHSGGTSNQTFP